MTKDECLVLITRLNASFRHNQVSDSDGLSIADVAVSYPSTIVEQCLRQLMSDRAPVSATAFRFRVGSIAGTAAARSQARRDQEEANYVPATHDQAQRWQAIIAYIQASPPDHRIRKLNAQWARSNQLGGSINEERALRMLGELEAAR